MNSETLFSMALGLQSPWQVKEVSFSTNEFARSELHLHIDFVSGSRFPDETNELCPVHDTVERLMCQHFSGHKVKQILAAIRSLLATNSYWPNEFVHGCKTPQCTQIYPA